MLLVVHLLLLGHGLLAALVVGLSLLCVAQYVVRHGELCEFVLCVCRTVFVGVVFERELSVGFLELLVIGLAVHAENLVVVSAGQRHAQHCQQKGEGH